MSWASRYPVVETHHVGEGPVQLLIEVPHGADEAAHYDAMREHLVGALPDRLERFFQVNTDVGAFAVGMAIAMASGLSTTVLRCLVPRTFIDVNRVVGEDVPIGLTPGLQPYIQDPADQAALRLLHARYTEHVQAAMEDVLGRGGRAIIPHTYAPRSVPIETVDADIVRNLDRVYASDVIGSCPLRPELDLVTLTPDDVDLSIPGVADAMITAFREVGIAAERDGSYRLHPVTMGARWANTWPGQTLCFEVRRDLVTHWDPFVPKRLRLDAIRSIGSVAAGVLTASS